VYHTGEEDKPDMEEKSHKRKAVASLEKENRSLRKRVGELVRSEELKAAQIEAMATRQRKLENMLLTGEQLVRLNRLCEGWVDVEGVDRRELLHRLWLNAQTCDFYLLAHAMGKKKDDPDQIDLDAVISKARENGGRVDYAVGRKMKIYLFDESRTLVDPRRYDEAWGKGSVKRIVKGMGRSQ
jgi:hypothetical protein